ncbi:helix-turn-helix domain-containing protein [Paenibacillus thiaminolyticus]|uniref:helix-turn-helix domain-containing protein n=1 Tax=Paenibacillus thiaminolyticus TaxID=49283 RepID=UPI002543A88B|nr:helix-turn-helix domain-containing protein [Paenibacillus thiaminolyticus]WII39120.1 helix-turn-helix domain-containing protein [Paenibacillus thiaminolyticus]
MRRSIIESAVQYIETHLKGPLHADEVARHVHISYYHFHRLFHAMTGETIGDYIRKRRLTEASLELMGTRRPILDIAVDYQFESHEAFTRAFKKVFGLSPYAFRRKGIRPVVNSKGALIGPRLRHRVSSISLEPEIVELERSITVIGLQGHSNLRDNHIPDMWSELLRQRREAPSGSLGWTAYGICQAMGAMPVHDLSEETIFGQFVGFEAAGDGAPPPGMAAYMIRPGKYAVFCHRGPTSLLRSSYEYIWGTWMQAASWELDDRDDFEQYGEDFYGTEHEDSIIRIFIPVKPEAGASG